MKKYLPWLGILILAIIVVAALVMGGPQLSVVHILNPLLMIVIPIILWVVLNRTFRLGWRLFFFGAFCFVLSQVFHLPFNFLVVSPLTERMGWQPIAGSPGLACISVIAGLSTGLFENITRYFVLRLWAREARDWERGLTFGAGHGGGEALILGLLSLVTMFQVLALRGVDLSTVLPAEQVEAAQAQIDAYWTTPWYLFLLAPLERIWAICLHICTTLLVVRSLVRRNLAWLGAAVLLHALLDTFAVYANTSWGPLPAEAGIMLIGLACLALIFYLRRHLPSSSGLHHPGQGGPAAVASGIPPSDDLTREQIEESRFG